MIAQVQWSGSARSAALAGRRVTICTRLTRVPGLDIIASQPPRFVALAAREVAQHIACKRFVMRIGELVPELSR
jgi:hypothetical protein